MPALADRTLALFGSRAGGNASFAWTSNVWYHIAYVVTPTSYKIYVNGVVTGKGTYPATNPANWPLLYDASHPLRIGDTGGGDPLMNGLIDEVRIWSTARTAAQIQANLGRPLLGNEPGLRGYWRFDNGGYLGPDPDSSGHGFEAIYLNGAHMDYPYPPLPFGL